MFSVQNSFLGNIKFNKFPSFKILEIVSDCGKLWKSQFYTCNTACLYFITVWNGMECFWNWCAFVVFRKCYLNDMNVIRFFLTEFKSFPFVLLNYAFNQKNCCSFFFLDTWTERKKKLLLKNTKMKYECAYRRGKIYYCIYVFCIYEFLKYRKIELNMYIIYENDSLHVVLKEKFKCFWVENKIYSFCWCFYSQGFFIPYKVPSVEVSSLMMLKIKSLDIFLV